MPAGSHGGLVRRPGAYQAYHAYRRARDLSSCLAKTMADLTIVLYRLFLRKICSVVAKVGHGTSQVAPNLFMIASDICKVIQNTGTSHTLNHPRVTLYGHFRTGPPFDH